MVLKVPTEVFDTSGERILIHRAWPRDDGSVVIEGREDGSGRVRAGRINPGGHPSLVPFCEDPSLPGLSPSRVSGGELLVHRLKRRAVVRSDGQFRKYVAGGKAAAVARAHVTAAARLAGSGLAVPDVVAADRHSVTLAAVPGVNLHDLAKSASNGDGMQESAGNADSAPWARWSRAWELWADRWPRFVGAQEVGGPLGAGPLVVAQSHTAEHEAGVVERWIDLAVSFEALEVSQHRLRSASASVVRTLRSGESPAMLSHRDLHDKQILIDPNTGTVGVIDCDTLARAEPALDLANLSVHLEFRVAQGLLSASAAAIGQHHIRTVAEVLQVPEERFNAYALATALRLACIYAFRPPYREVAHAWLCRIEPLCETNINPL